MAALIRRSTAKPAGTPAAPPCTLVIFGASRRPDQAPADAGARTICSATGCSTTASRSSASTASRTPTRASRKTWATHCTRCGSGRRQSGDRADAGLGLAAPAASTTCRATSPTRRPIRRWRRNWPSASGRPAATPCSTSPSRRASSARSSTALARRRPARGERRRGFRRRGDREAVRHRPAPPPQALNAKLLKVAAEKQIYRIDHYPRQGDGPEHHGLPLRQRHLRADLEPRPHRPRADHRRRDGRRRAARQLLRRAPARCATWCRTTCSSCWPWWRWSRRTRFDADAVRTEKAKVVEAMRDLTPTRRGQMRCAASTTPARSLGKPLRGLSRRSRTWRRDSRTETYRRAEAGDRQLALGRRAVLPAHRQVAGARATPRSPSSSSRRRAVLFRDTAGRRPDAEPAGAPASSPTKASRCASPPRCRGARCGCARSRWTSATPSYFKAEPQHRLRDADLRLPDRRPDAVPARRQHRGRLVRGAADPATLGRADHPAGPLPGRQRRPGLRRRAAGPGRLRTGCR